MGILTRPLDDKLCNVKRLTILAIGRLHNFILMSEWAKKEHGASEPRRSKRSATAGSTKHVTPSNADLDCHETVMKVAAADIEYEEVVAAFENPLSYKRDHMA